MISTIPEPFVSLGRGLVSRPSGPVLLKKLRGKPLFEGIGLLLMKGVLLGAFFFYLFLPSSRR